MSRPEPRVLLASILAVLTLLAGQPGARTVVSGEALKPSGEWEGLRGAEIVGGNDGSIVVSTAPTGKAARLQRLIPMEAASDAAWWRLRLSVIRLSSNRGASDPQRDRVTIAYLSNGEMLGWAPTVRAGFWRRNVEVDVLLQQPLETDALSVSFATPSVGEWRLSPLSVMPVIRAPWHDAVAGTLLIGWGALFAWLLIPALRRRGGWMAGVAVMFGVSMLVLGTGFSRSALSIVTGPLASALGRFSEGSIGSLTQLIQKSGHFLVFLLLVVALARYRRVFRLSLVSVLWLCIAFAVGSEALQLYLDDRATRLSDLFIDLGGMVVGMTFYGAAWVVNRRVVSKPVGADEVARL